MPDAPAIRGRVVQGIAGRIGELAKSDAEALRAKHGSTLQAMSRVQASAWIPQAQVMPILDTLSTQLGTDQYFEFHREGVRRAVQGPLLSAVHDGSLRLFALEPRGVLRHTPNMWLESLRGCGYLDPVQFLGQNKAQITLRDVPPILVGPPFLEATRAQIAATLDICGCSNEVEQIHGGDPWVYELRW